MEVREEREGRNERRKEGEKKRQIPCPPWVYGLLWSWRCEFSTLCGNCYCGFSKSLVGEGICRWV
jgi:hypothetical protein